MTKQSENPVVFAAYDRAWKQFSRWPGLTPDERLNGPQKIFSYVQAMADAGEQNAEKIAASALGLLREYEQIVRSEAMVESRDRMAVAQAAE